MPILTSVITDRMRRVGLDAENATYYDDNLDLIPAINAAIEWLVSVINSVYGSSKLSEEFFRELTNSAVFQTSEYSRINFSQHALFTDDIWTIIAVYPLPQVHHDTSQTAVLSTSYIADSTATSPEVSVDTAGVALNEWTSLYRPELTHIDSDYDCKRLTAEEWIGNKRNPFTAGNEDAFNVEYAYISHIDHSSYKSQNNAYANFYDQLQEIEIRPVLNQKLATIIYVKRPNLVTGLTDNIEFPEAITTLLYEKALQFVSFKQGDNTSIYTVTNNDLQTLTNAMM